MATKSQEVFEKFFCNKKAPDFSNAQYLILPFYHIKNAKCDILRQDNKKLYTTPKNPNHSPSQGTPKPSP
ncbi:hypothetical protein, partial [Streptococcus suis]|uniref:hypothetical protein n=1 Tax=Streptococcus suis TaxID=1307 RepID=UPI001EE740C7